MRIFFAFEIPEEVIGQVEKFQKKHKRLPMRWTPVENLHATVLFVGWVQDGVSTELTQALRAYCKTVLPACIRFEKIDWAPPGNRVRMIWLYGNAPVQFTAFKAELKNILEAQGIGTDKDTRPFSPHVTLARMKPRARGNLPAIETPAEYSFVPKEVLLMESKLSRKGAEYDVVERFVFRHE